MARTITLDFEIGDRVRVTHPGPDNGKEGVIRRVIVVENNIFYDLGVYRENIKDFMPYSAPYLELVER